jgi:hypothetical protein
MSIVNQKSIMKIFKLFLILIVFTTTTVSSSFTKTTYAQSAQTNVQNYLILQWGLRCYNNDEIKLTDAFGVSATNPPIYTGPDDIEAPVGYDNDSGDQQWDCSSSSHSSRLRAALGVDFSKYREKYYEKSGDEYVVKDDGEAQFKKDLDAKIKESEPKEYEFYPTLVSSFLGICAKGGHGYEDNTTIPEGDEKVITNYIGVEDGTDVGKRYFIVEDASKQVSVGLGVPGAASSSSGDAGKMSCQQILEKIRDIGPKWAEYKKTEEGKKDGSSVDKGADTDDEIAPNCENTSGVTGWIICPIIDGAFSLMRVIEGALVGQLNFTLDDIGQDDKSAYDNVKAAYNSILVTANVLFAIGILWIVISQAITGGGGGGFFGAYEAKKILPKLIAGIIVANLAWDLVNLLLIVSNALGESIKSIMLAPFGDAATQAIDLGGWSGVLAGGAAVGAVALAFFGFFAVSPILIMIVISILLALAFAVFRKAIIVVLVILAPIALALSPFMPSLFKRYYKLLLNLILFYPIVMIAIAGTTIVAYITIQSAGNADSIGSSLVRLAGMAIYFGWIFLVLGFAKNNFDVMGKVGGSLQSMGNKAGRQFGQGRLQGNQRRQERELKKNWRLQKKKEKALDSSFNKMTYKGDNPLKRTRARAIQAQQGGLQAGRLSKAGARVTSKIPLVGKRAGKYLDDKIADRESERTYMMSVAEDQVLEASVKKAEQEASYKSFSGVPYLKPKVYNQDGELIKDKDGNPIKISTLNDANMHLAAGRRVSWVDRNGQSQDLDGSNTGVRYMAAGQLAQAGDGVQALSLDAIANSGSSESGTARSSLDYMMSKGGGSFAKSTPHLMGIPGKTYMSAGSEALMGYKPATISVGTEEVLRGGDDVSRTQMLNSIKELNLNTNLAGTRKEGHMQAFKEQLENHLAAGGSFGYDGTTYSSSNEADLYTKLGF